MKTAIVNIATIITGDWREPYAKGDTILMEDGKITSVGTGNASAVEACDVVIDAAGCTAIPGLIDSQVHNTFGDYTPRQKTVGFLESYVHGGVTTGISASEVHVTGRPKDPEGVKALAVAALKSFEHYRPGGMRMWAGSVILEPGLVEADFKELADKGVWLAKAGFGAVESPYDYAPMVHWAKDNGMITTVHTGGSSIPGSSGIWFDHLKEMQPHVSFHVNGGPIAMPDEDFPRIVNESDIALQICTAGNMRTAIWITDLATEADAFDRLLIATDTPTGSGIMPLGMIYTITLLAAVGTTPPSTCPRWCHSCDASRRTGSMQRTTVFSSSSAEIMITGSPRRSSSACRRSRTSYPSISGIITSSRMTSGTMRSAAASPSGPSAAPSTW